MLVRPAVAAALAGLLLAACASEPAVQGSPAPTDATSTPSNASPSPTDDVAAEPAWASLGEAVDLGDGVLLGATPDRKHLWVRAPDPDSAAMGCEGMPFEFLWIVDPATGARSLAIPDLAVEDQPMVTSIATQFAVAGHVALVSACEGFLSSIWVGTTADDGTIADTFEVPEPGVEVRANTVRWLPGGTELMAVGQADAGSPGVLVADPVVGEWHDIDATPYADWVPLGDGRVAEVIDGTATFVDGEGTEFTSLIANEVIPGPDGMPALALWYGDGDDASGRLDLVAADGTFTRLTDVAGYASAISDDGAWVTWSTADDDGNIVVVLHDLATGFESQLDDAYFSGMTWLDSGIAWVVEGPRVDGTFGLPAVRFRPYAG